MKKLLVSSLVLISLLLTLLLCGCSSTPTTPDDGSYTSGVTVSGTDESVSLKDTASITIQDGIITAEIVWPGADYEYMVVDNETISAEATDEGCAFSFPIERFDVDIPVTVGGSDGEFDCSLLFDFGTFREAE